MNGCNNYSIVLDALQLILQQEYYMSEGQSKAFSEFSFYVSGQIERINSALQNHSQVVAKLQQMNSSIRKQERRFSQMESKIKLLEVYQSENFKNNERIFNSHPFYQVVHEKINILQQMQANIYSCKQQRTQRTQNEQQFFLNIEKRVRDLEVETTKLKGKSVVLNKFRREISPTLPNCDSTKDISFDRTSNGQIKKLEARMHDYINQRLKVFEKKYSPLLNNNSQQTQPTQEEQFNLTKRLSTSKLKESNVYQIKKDQQGSKVGENNFKNTIDHYYSRTTERQELQNRSWKDTRRSQEKNKIKVHKTTSKSKSNKKIKSNSAKKSISLKSVNQYLKLAKNK